MYVSGGSLATVPTGQPLPVRLSIVNVRNGQVEQVPGPYPRRLSTQLRAASGGRLVTTDAVTGRGGTAQHSSKTRITSYASGGTQEPVELGGVRPTAWPNPCRLFVGVHRSPDDRYDHAKPGDPDRIGDQTIKRPSCRRYSTDLDVVWVARTEREAAAVFGPTSGRSFGADQAYEFRDKAEGRTSRLLRVGRVIVQLDTTTSGCGRDIGACYDPDAIARAVVENLR